MNFFKKNHYNYDKLNNFINSLFFNQTD
jgi:hypothetical protein